MSTVKQAIEVAMDAHRNQEDKSEEAYILHPLSLMQQMETEAEKEVAILHDVVEDSEKTLEDLRKKGFSKKVVEAVKHLTKAERLKDRELGTNDESYEEFIDRVDENELARKIKVADLEHNMDLTRLKKLTDSDLERIEKYHRSWKELKEEA
jgi:(p)ppGpp synthase/HD superfamily hydrolase